MNIGTQYPLDDISDVITKGTTPTTLGYSYVSNGIPFIRATNLGEKFVDCRNDVLHIDRETDQALKRSRIMPGDVLLAIAGTIGRSSVVPADSAFLNCNQAVCIIRPNSKVDRFYLKHWLGSEAARQQIDASTVTGVISNLSLSQVRALKVPLPSLAEQRRIAAILDKADTLRTKRREAIAKLDKLLQSVFLDMFGDVEKNEQGWPVVCIGDLIESTKLGLVRAASEFGGEKDFDTPYIRMDAIGRRGEFIAEKVKNTTATMSELSEFSVRYGDLLFNTRNSKELVGKSAIFDRKSAWTFNNNLMRIRFKESVNSFYVLRYLLSRRGQMELEKRKSGTTSVFAIYYKDLKSLPVVVPPKDLQESFQRAVERLKQVGNHFSGQDLKLQTLIDSIQKSAFSGRLLQG